MPAYLVSLPLDKSGQTLHCDGIAPFNALLLWANDEAQAKALAGAYAKAPALWDTATATEIAAQATYEGWRFRITVGTSIDVTVTADSDDTMDDIGAKLVTALNATAINGAAYTAGSNTLKIVETTDNLGAAAIGVYVMAPLGRFGEADHNFTSFWSSLTAPGAAGIARSVVLNEVARPVPYGSGVFSF